EVVVVANGGAQVDLAGVRVLRRTEPGRSEARNLGVEVARTPFVAFLDDDDLALPGRLARQRAALEEAWWAPLAFGRVRVVDGDGRPRDDWNRLLGARFDRLVVRGAGYAEVLAAQAPIYTSATMVRRDGFLAVGGYDAAFEAYEDLDLYLRLARIGDLLPVDGDPVTTYRLHGANTPSERLYDGALGVELRGLCLAANGPRRNYPLYEREAAFESEVLPGRDALVGGRWLVVNVGVLGRLRRLRPDVVLVGGWNQPAFWQALAFARA